MSDNMQENILKTIKSLMTGSKKNEDIRESQEKEADDIDNNNIFEDKDIIKDIYEAVNSTIKHLFVCSNDKLQETFLNEAKRLINEDRKKKERYIADQISEAILKSFAKKTQHNKQISDIESIEFISFIVFLNKINENMKKIVNASINKDDSNIAKLFSDDFLKVIGDDIRILSKGNLFERIEFVAQEIYKNGLNNNSSAVFAFKDLIEKEYSDILPIDYVVEATKTVHSKPFSVEKIFY